MRRVYFLSVALLAFAGPAYAEPTSGVAPIPVAPPPDATTAPMKRYPTHRGQGPVPRGTSQEAFGTATEIPRGHEPGGRGSHRAFGKASNAPAVDRRWPVAPRLPPLTAEENPGPSGYLADARMALDYHQTVRAQEALERAETAMLDRSVLPSRAGLPNESDGVVQIRNARDALARGDIFGAKMAIAAALRPG